MTGVDIGLLVSFMMLIIGAALLRSGFRRTESDSASVVTVGAGSGDAPGVGNLPPPHGGFTPERPAGTRLLSKELGRPE
jgi:hypothetical protein